jgi:hypothetical protein
MRKFALLLAAAALVSAPMLTTVPTESFAAEKAKAKSAEPKMPDNRGLFDALGDNMAGKAVTAKADKGGMGGMGGKKAKKSSKGGMGGMGGMSGGMGSGGMGSGGMGSGGMGGDSGAAKK